MTNLGSGRLGYFFLPLPVNRLVIDGLVVCRSGVLCVALWRGRLTSVCRGVEEGAVNRAGGVGHSATRCVAGNLEGIDMCWVG